MDNRQILDTAGINALHVLADWALRQLYAPLPVMLAANYVLTLASRSTAAEVDAENTAIMDKTPF